MCGYPKTWFRSIRTCLCGGIDAYFERSLKPWDYAAGMLLVEEAGGKVTDYKGNPVDITGNSDIVAGSQTIGEILVEKYL